MNGTEPGALPAAADLRKTYGATPALDGASIEMDAGEVVAVMGPSGSGKSTLLHCLAAIVTPDGGSVRCAGRELSKMSDRGGSALRRSDFGFVFRFGQLVPEPTCGENVALPLRPNGVPRRRANVRGRQWPERPGVAELAGRRPGEVSGGRARRVAVARALARAPRVVFADEPTGALDSLTGERVMHLPTSAAREDGAAVALATHETRGARYADREVVVCDGRTTTSRRVPAARP